MEQWSIVKSTDMAAALGTLGMPVRVMRGLELKQAKESVSFYVGLINVEGTERTNQLKAGIVNGTLKEQQPRHPLLTILATFENRDRLLDCINRGQLIELVQQPCGLWVYKKSDCGFSGLKADVPAIKTGDIKVVAALGRIGLPVMMIEGERNRRVFFVQAMRMEEGRVINGGELMQQWRKDPESIPWEEPFAQAMRGLHNRERLMDAIRSSNIRVTILQPGGGPRSAVVSATPEGNVSGKAMDAVADFFE